MNPAQAYELDPDLRLVQEDILLQAKLDRAFERELDTLISSLQAKRLGVISHREQECRRYYAIERTLCPPTTIKPTRSPRKNNKKHLTKEETINQLAKLCSPEIANMVADLMSGKETP